MTSRPIDRFADRSTEAIGFIPADRGADRPTDRAGDDDCDDGDDDDDDDDDGKPPYWALTKKVT